MRKGNINNKPKESNELHEELKVTTEPVELEDNVNTNEMVQTGQAVKNQKSQNETKKDKQKVIILLVVAILAISITIGLLVFKYLSVNRNVASGSTSTNYGNEQVSQIKKETQDTKYLVSFTDMYTINPITITDKLYEKEATKKQGSISAGYVQISGLQDHELQEKINNEIKNNALYYSDKVTAKQSYNSNTSVEGNFSNILSVYTYIYIYEDDEMVFDEEIYLNYNLATGEKIKFLDLFASNTPMNSIIYDLEYERLAWDTDINLDMSEKEWDKATNMDKRDTSEYEDIILKVINKYKSLDKDKINFYVTPNRIQVNLNVGEGGEEVSYSIKLYKYIDYVTMYKKFLTDKVIYENVASNKLLVFNDMIGFLPEYYKIEENNLFMSIFSYMDEEYMKEEEQAWVEKYSQAAVNKKNELMEKHTETILEEVRKLAKSNKNKGYMARFMPYSYIDDYENDYGSETLIYISLDGSIEEMNIDYYRENAFKLLAKQNVAPKASVDDLLIGRLAYNDKNVKSLLYNEGEEDIVDLSGYYTLDGTLVAKTYEEVEKYIDSKYTEPEQIPEETTEVQTEVNVYREEE